MSVIKTIKPNILPAIGHSKLNNQSIHPLTSNPMSTGSRIVSKFIDNIE